MTIEDQIIAKLKRVTYDEMYYIWVHSAAMKTRVGIQELFIKHGWTIDEYINDPNYYSYTK